MIQSNTYLILFRQSQNQRAHVAVYVTADKFPGSGTLIHVLGAPMIGFILEIKPNYKLMETTRLYTYEFLGETTDEGLNTMKAYARVVPAPGVSRNPLAPVDGINNKDCQTWLNEYVEYLVQRGVFDASALATVRAKNDPPGHGVGLRPVR